MPSPPHPRVLLINVTGHDHTGVTYALTGILGQHGARILDIGQAVIHDALTLGFLVALADGHDTTTLETALRDEAQSLGMQIRFTAIAERAYDTWVRAQAKRRFLVTLLGPSITAGHLTQVSGIVTRRGLNI